MAPQAGIQRLHLGSIPTPERCMFRTLSTTLLPLMADPSATSILHARDWCFSLYVQSFSTLPHAATQASFGETGNEAGSPKMI